MGAVPDLGLGLQFTLYTSRTWISKENLSVGNPLPQVSSQLSLKLNRQTAMLARLGGLVVLAH